MKNQTTLIVGANSDIAKAIAQKIVLQTENEPHKKLIVVSRNTAFYQQAAFDKTLVLPINNYQEQTIANIVKSIKSADFQTVTQVYICHGVLHSNNFQPEKRLEDFSEQAFLEVIQANTLVPMLWLKTLTPVLSNTVSCNEVCKITFFSARVGSISDNKLGGWYSYRSSKAALNMLLKSAAVELSRRAKNIKLISFHPGTTDTPLSKPFQKNVPSDKLFTGEFVASQLLKIVEHCPVDGQLSYLDWEGKHIPW